MQNFHVELFYLIFHAKLLLRVLQKHYDIEIRQLQFRQS